MKQLFSFVAFVLLLISQSKAQSVTISKSYGECQAMEYSFTVSTAGFVVAGDEDAYVWEVNGATCTSCPVIPVHTVYYIPSGSHTENTVVTCKVKSTTGAVYTGSYTIHYERTDEPLFAHIRVLPERYPFIYCSDEVVFKAETNPDIPVSYAWYHHGGSGVGTSATYDPETVDSNDEITVTVSTTANCVSPRTITSTLDLRDAGYNIDEQIRPFDLFVSGGLMARCKGSGTTVLYSNATNFKIQQWSISPSIAGVVSSSANGYEASINWSSSFSGTATITTTAIGCVNQMSKQIMITVHDAPITPLQTSIEQCNFESVSFSKESISNSTGVASCKWFDSDESLIASGDKLELPALKDGNYTYKVKFVNDLGCESLQFGTIDLQVGYYPHCEQRLNTIETIGYGIGYTEEGNPFEQEVSHTKSYFDLSGKLLQSQAKSFSTYKIQTSQVIKDQYDRPVISTLSAPIDEYDFQYKHYFATDTDGNRYDHQSIGEPMGNTEPGTIGWYYSSNNTLESNIPVTNYPYVRSDFYTDGTGEARSSAQPGEVHRMGMGHESLSGTFPVYSELDDYLAKRSDILPGVMQPTTLKNAGVLTVVRDENHKYAVSFTDKSAKALMSALPGTESDHVFSVSNSIKSSGNITPPSGYDYRILTYFCILTEQPVSLTGIGNYVVEDLIHDQPFTPPSTGQNWPIGFYRIVLGDASSSIQLTYQSYFKDVSYQFYDDAGRLISSISPNGVIQWKDGTAYESIDHTTYKYNFRGWLMEMKETDAGTTKYQYRKDSKIRFSQNALQAENEAGNKTNKGKFSYTNYDYLGRPLESGEYIGAESFTSQSAKLEFDTQIVYPQNECKDWVRTYYDEADPNFILIDIYKQYFVRGAVSYTENANIRTWYSYDEFGRVTWMAQKPKALPRVFVVKYSYDFLGNVLTVANLSYSSDGNDNLLSEFYHHYEYDADQRLIKAYTSLLPQGEKKLRASYFYYLHGPLKRIELGDKLQGLDFVYNINGWLTQINHPDPAQDPGGDTNDVFGMVLDYYQSDLTNLFSADIGNKHDPSLIHGLPADMRTMVAQNTTPLIRFIPSNDDFNTSYFKDMSVSSPIYKQMIFQQLQKTN